MYFAKVIIINNQLNTSFRELVRSSGCMFIQSLLVCVCVRACAQCTVKSKTEKREFLLISLMLQSLKAQNQCQSHTEIQCVLRRKHSFHFKDRTVTVV
jgi:hypothetical protein